MAEIQQIRQMINRQSGPNTNKVVKAVGIAAAGVGLTAVVVGVVLAAKNGIGVDTINLRQLFDFANPANNRPSRPPQHYKNEENQPVQITDGSNNPRPLLSMWNKARRPPNPYRKAIDPTNMYYNGGVSPFRQMARP
jgi:hypothetical protein